jgi:hypothetical protein
MAGQFSIELVGGQLLLYKLSGFFDAQDLRRFQAEIDAAFARLTCPPNTHLSLLNVSECALQSQAVVAGFEQLLARPDRRARRTAFVLETSLARMQVRRLLPARPDTAMFEDEASALAWLRADDALAA